MLCVITNGLIFQTCASINKINTTTFPCNLSSVPKMSHCYCAVLHDDFVKRRFVPQSAHSSHLTFTHRKWGSFRI